MPMCEITPEYRKQTIRRFREKAQRDQLARENGARKEERLKIARNFLDIADDQTIATITKLPIAEVAALRANTSHPQQ